jgi:glycosyltransferase involved in cell wall biosynthesis
MASSKAIVVSRRGGIPEIGQSAVHYIDPCDAAGLADALRTLGRDPRRRRQLAAAAGRRAQDLRWSEQYRLLMEFIASTSGLR